MQQPFEIPLDIPDVTIESVGTNLAGHLEITVKSTVEGTPCHRCGQGQLAEELKEIHTVHSFDHIAIRPNIVSCDMAQTPLDDGTLDAAIFSLSLMGSNLADRLENRNDKILGT